MRSGKANSKEPFLVPLEAQLSHLAMSSLPQTGPLTLMHMSFLFWKTSCWADTLLVLHAAFSEWHAGDMVTFCGSSLNSLVITFAHVLCSLFNNLRATVHGTLELIIMRLRSYQTLIRKWVKKCFLNFLIKKKINERYIKNNKIWYLLAKFLN